MKGQYVQLFGLRKTLILAPSPNEKGQKCEPVLHMAYMKSWGKGQCVSENKIITINIEKNILDFRIFSDTISNIASMLLGNI